MLWLLTCLRQLRITKTQLSGLLVRYHTPCLMLAGFALSPAAFGLVDCFWHRIRRLALAPSSSYRVLARGYVHGISHYRNCLVVPTSGTGRYAMG